MSQYIYDKLVGLSRGKMIRQITLVYQQINQLPLPALIIQFHKYATLKMGFPNH